MKKTFLKKIISIFLILVVMLEVYLLAEPVIAASVSDGVLVTLTVDAGITISDGSNVTMAPTIGVASDSSIGSSYWTVRTNNVSGYTLAVKASTNPALTSGASTFEDYTETVDGTPEPWSVPAGSKEFGFSSFGTDSSTSTWGTSQSCGGAGVPAANQNYLGFTTSDQTIATRPNVTPTTGVTTTICFAAEQDTIYADSGTYTATITATATTL